MERKSRLQALILVMIILTSGILMLRNVSQPWAGKVDGDGGLFSIIAGNYLRYGALKLHLGQAVSVVPESAPEKLTYYQHHPPLMPLLTAGSFALLGEAESSARLVPIGFTLGSIVLIFLLGRRLYGGSVGLLAAGIFATLPAVVYFGRKVGYEAQTQFFILLTLWFYIELLRTDRNAAYVGLCCAMLAGFMTDWPAYLLLPVILAHFIWAEKESRWRKPIVLGLPAIALISVALFAYLTFLASPSSVTSVLYQGMAYMGVLAKDGALTARYSEAGISFTAWQFVKQTLLRLDLLYAYPILVTGIVGMWNFRSLKNNSNAVCWMLLFVAFAYCVIFYRSVFIHLWHTYYLSAPIALFSALGMRTLFLRGEELRLEIPLLFVAGLILAGAVPRIVELSSLQWRLLPGEQREEVDFVKAVGLRIRGMASERDLIVTPLVRDRSYYALSYYAKRLIVSDRGDWSRIFGSEGSESRPEHVHYLRWLGGKDAPPPNPEGWVSEHSEFEVQGHRFEWWSYRMNEASR